jgi:hypothetical protein
MSGDTSTPQTQKFVLPVLDEDLYNLGEEERAFLKQQTGIQDDDELKAHVLQLQAEAYKVCNFRSTTLANLCMFTPLTYLKWVHPYSCIRRFAFAK